MARFGRAARKGIEGLAAFERDLDKFLDPEDLVKEWKPQHGKTVAGKMIGAAKDGLGPGGTRYPPYSEQYAKTKGVPQSGKVGEWLVGVKGQSQRMLDPKNFTWEFQSPGNLVCVWTPANKHQAEYGPVHNDGSDKIPARPWMHFEAPETEKVLFQTLDLTIGNRTVVFNAKWSR